MKSLLLIPIVIVLFAQTGVAQSGRKKTAPPSPSPVNQIQTQTPAASPSPSPQAQASPTPASPKFHPNGFIITGRLITEGGKSYWSDDVAYVANEIKFMWDLEKVPVKVSKIGKTTRTQAIDRAKRETDTYVLYLEIHEKIGNGISVISTVNRIDYVLLMPGTGEVVRKFVVDPASIVQTNEHGTQLPPRTQGRSNSYNDQLRRCAWEMAKVLRFWL